MTKIFILLIVTFISVLFVGWRLSSKFETAFTDYRIVETMKIWCAGSGGTFGVTFENGSQPGSSGTFACNTQK